MKETMSCLVMRPPRPVPTICARLIPCSRAILRTRGDERASSSPSVEVSGAKCEMLLDGAAACDGMGFCSMLGEGFSETASAAPAPTAAEAVSEKPSPSIEQKPIPSQAAAPSSSISHLAPETSTEGEEEARSSPLVRKIAREHGINLAQIVGTGLGGRITKQDIVSFIRTNHPQRPCLRVHPH